MLLFHLSSDPNLEVLEPQKPDLLETEDVSDIKVVKFAPSINGFLNIIGPLNVVEDEVFCKKRDEGYFDPEVGPKVGKNYSEYIRERGKFQDYNTRGFTLKEEWNIGTKVPLYPQFYVYVPVEKITYHIPTEKEVFNVSFTGEVDVLDPVPVERIGSIMVLGKSMMMEPKMIKWKGHYINYAPYYYEFARFDSDMQFLSDMYPTRKEYDEFFKKCSTAIDGFKELCREAYPDHNWDFDDAPDLDLEIEKVSDRIEQMEMSRKTDPAPVSRSKPKQRNQYSLPKKKKEIVLKK